ncbi:MAG: hypothetical protein HRU01_10530 [Myxococcales bacterium]|nr:hypothetical protein [Myxococcales bacterium]
MDWVEISQAPHTTRRIAPLLSDPAAPWDRPAYSYGVTPVGYAGSIRDERHRYTEWDHGRAGAASTDHSRREPGA